MNRFKNNYRFKDRRESSIYNMRVFHNWIKRTMINDTMDYIRNNYSNNIEGINNISLLDLSCGRGSDILKYYDAGIQKVIGFDIDYDSIQEAKKRFGELINNLKRKNVIKLPNYEFYVMDLSNPDNIDKIKKILGDKKFQIIVCQFAIHYFFKSQETLETLIKIVNNSMYCNKLANTDIPCFFLGTTMNGDYIKDCFLKNKQLKNNLYDISNKTPNDKLNNPYNNKYVVQLGMKGDKEHYFVDKPSEEYLFNLDELIKVCDKNNFNFIGSKLFSEWYNMYLDSNPKNKLSNDEKEFSFLNLSFIFMSKRN